MTENKSNPNPWYLRLLQLVLGIAIILGSVYGWKVLGIEGILMVLSGIGGLTLCYLSVKPNDVKWDDWV